MRIVKTAFLAWMIGAGSAAYAAAPLPDVHIALHKALYDFRMVAVETGTGVNNIKGKMYFEQDDACDAWTTEHRFTTEYQYAERPGESDASHYVAFEAKNQSQFSFSSEREENGEVAEQLRGAIKVAPDGAAKAVYSRPDALAYDLPKGYLLPTTHTIEVIRHARAGDHFFDAVVFDGTDADGPVEINTFIGKKLSASDIKKIAARNKTIDPALLTPDAWHIRMAVFPLKNTKELMPSYEMDTVMHDNGVISYTLIDYRTFKIEQNLLALTRLAAKKCG